MFLFQYPSAFPSETLPLFDIGNDHYYYDDFANDDIITRLAEQSYMPMADTLLEMIRESNGTFKCAISISGTAIEQLQLYVPEFIDKLKQLADTGCVEFLCRHLRPLLSSLEDHDEFIREVKQLDRILLRLFGVKTKTFANTELIYDDDIAMLIAGMGFRNCLTAGAKHVLGWKSPNYVYKAATASNLRLLITNDKLAGDISMNFNRTEWDEYPLTADKYLDWIASSPEQEQVVNMFLSMDTFGTFIPESTGIFRVHEGAPALRRREGYQILHTIGSMLAAETGRRTDHTLSPCRISTKPATYPHGKERTAERGPLETLPVAERVSLCDDRRLKLDWEYLQSSDHFYYMCTKNISRTARRTRLSARTTRLFSAFTNYMNVLADFLVRVQEQFPESIDNEELNPLLLTIRNQAAEIASLNKEVTSLRINILNSEEKAAMAEIEAEPEIPESCPRQETSRKEKFLREEKASTRGIAKRSASAQDDK